MERKIICPYCFESVDESEVLFRANTGFTLDDINEAKASGKVKQDELSRMQLFLKYDDTDRIDEKLVSFWNKRGGARGYIYADANWDMPHIDPKDPKFELMLSDDPLANAGEDGFVRDKDGFVLRVYDRYSDPFTHMTRICPECHNPYPLLDYGKYAPIFVGIVGITSCGKTVFLNQLLSTLAITMHGTGYSIGVNNLNTMGEVVEPDQPLPGSSDSEVMRRPLAVNIQDPNDSSKGFTLVFYDIAGENCKKPEAGKDKSKNEIGHFIARSNALMFLIDPNQIPGFSSGIPDVNSISDVVDNVQEIRTALGGEPWSEVPVAVVLTKSDLLNDNVVLKDTPITQHSQTEKGFGRDDFIIINTKLKKHFSTNVTKVYAALAPFPKKAFFAVSAITCGVESRFSLHQNMYFLDEENERKFRQLTEWKSGWNKRSPEERQFYHNCPIRDKDGRAIEFSITENVNERNCQGITTEVFADCEHGRLHLSLWDIVSEKITLVGYPKSFPNPRRVEEPLKWMLWIKKKIGPDYVGTDRPVKKFLEPEKKYAQRCQEWQEMEMQNEKLFYEGGEKNEG